MLHPGQGDSALERTDGLRGEHERDTAGQGHLLVAQLPDEPLDPVDVGEAVPAGEVEDHVTLPHLAGGVDHGGGLLAIEGHRREPLVRDAEALGHPGELDVRVDREQDDLGLARHEVVHDADDRVGEGCEAHVGGVALHAHQADARGHSPLSLLMVRLLGCPMLGAV